MGIVKYYFKGYKMFSKFKWQKGVFALSSLLLSSHLYAAIGGTAYLEVPANGVNANTYGVKDGNEPGVAGVTVTVTDSNGQSQSVTTGSDGSWSVNLSAPARVEYSNWPSYLSSAPDGSGSATSVQFIDSDSNSVNFGLLDTNDYTKNIKPDYITNVFISGSNKTSDAMLLVRNKYDDNELNKDFKDFNGNQGTGPRPTIDFQAKDMGAVWGKAWDSYHKKLYVSAVLVRHVGFADGNPSRIWVVDYSGSGAPTKSWFDLQGVKNIDLGSVTRSSGDGTDDNSLPDDPTKPSHDLDAYAKVGKISYGDIEYDVKNHTLWAINLNEKALISIDSTGIDTANNTVDSAKVHQYKLSDMNAPSCNGGELRPWALSIHNGKGYIGAVCDALNSQDQDDLKAYVLSYDLKNPSAGLTKEVEYSLNYDRPDGGLNRIDPKFFPWSDLYHDGTNGFEKEDGNKHNVEDDGFDTYNQPILADIAFDEKNNMYWSILDRYGMQIGFNNNPAYHDSNNTKERNYGSGELKKLCWVNNAWEMESNGSVTCPAGDENRDDTLRDPETNFFEDYAGDDMNHADGAGMALVAGSNQLLRTISEPHKPNEIGEHYWTTNGVSTYSTTTGAVENWYMHFRAKSDSPYAGGKSVGLGDLELMTDPAPIEIGNRVWDDTDGDGIQDAGESGIDGVKVQLICGGTKVAEATTENGGYYIFSSDPNGATTTSHIYNITELTPGRSDCKVVIPDPTNQTPLSGKVASSATQGSDKQVDSDGVMNNSDDEATVSPNDIDAPGSNNHTYDFGFSEQTTYCLGDFVWEDTNKNGQQDSGEAGIANVKVTLSTGATTTTNENGKYEFCNLENGDYNVTFDKTTLPNGYVITSQNSGDDTTDSDANSDGVVTGATIQDANNTTVDMGAYKVPEICLGDYVWYDENLNGIQDKDEPGVIDIPVTLTYADGSAVKDVFGNPVKVTKTDNKGYYKFCQLIPAKDYKIHFKIPNTYHATLKDQGSDATDNDADINGNIFVIHPVRDNMTLDMGIYCDCDDYKIHPENHKELKMPALNLLGLLAMVSALYFVVVARRREDELGN